MPPIREITHEINFIDPDLRPTYHLPTCPDTLKPELAEKIARYEKAGWWKRVTTDSAAPLLYVYKKDRQLRTAVDAHKHNENTIKDVTPFPDQDGICHDVAHAMYRTKLDMSDAYKQVQVKDSDVHKTVFATIHGTFISFVVQQGDCNAPSTFQCLMMFVFREQISLFVHVYLDDIFIYLFSLHDHEQHLKIVFNIL
jgi:Reverse transcriptase (RNA-dependent DNA polymerase)